MNKSQTPTNHDDAEEMQWWRTPPHHDGRAVWRIPFIQILVVAIILLLFGIIAYQIVSESSRDIIPPAISTTTVTEGDHSTTTTIEQSGHGNEFAYVLAFLIRVLGAVTLLMLLVWLMHRLLTWRE